MDKREKEIETMDKKMKNDLAGCAVLIFIFILTIGLGFVTNIYTMNMWKWFMVPLGLPALSYWHTYGLTSFISLVFHNGYRSNEDEGNWDLFKRVIVRFIVCTVFYFGLMLVHSFM